MSVAFDVSLPSRHAFLLGKGNAARWDQALAVSVWSASRIMDKY